MPKVKKPEPKTVASGIPVWCHYDALAETADLRPSPRNKNVHPQKQLVAFGKVVTKNGWRRAIVVSNLSGCIVKGHGAWEMAKFIGLNQVPVCFQDYATEAQELQDLLADNEIGRQSYNDIPGLREQMSELDGDMGGDLEATGFDAKFVDDLLGRTPEPPPPEPKTAGAPKMVCCPNCQQEFEVKGNEVG